MQLSTRDAEGVFAKLEMVEVRSTHHVRGYFYLNGVRLFSLHYSRGNKDMPANVPHLFRKGMRLSTDEFRRFRVCTMSRDEYIRLMRQRKEFGL